MKRFFAVTILSLILTLPWTSQSVAGQAWEKLKSGQAIAILCHALAPGTGDPAHFDLTD